MAEEKAYSFEHMKKISDVIASRTRYRPSILIICGSGLSALGESVEDPDVVDYKDVPDLPQSTVPGHQGRFLFGRLGDRIVACMQGRFHPYEGYPMWKCAMPVRLMKLLGARYLIVTNAAGGVNPQYRSGDIMLIKDFISIPGMAGSNPLKGINDERWGPRFPAMNGALCPILRQYAHDIAVEVGANDFIREGTYCMLGGPNFETVAETRMLRIIGVDACGMSTCHEIVTAAHCGLRTVGISLVSNECIASYETTQTVSHDDVLQSAAQRKNILQQLVTRLVARMN